MHNNYYVFKQLTAELNNRLVGERLIACFSQNKNELLLAFSSSSSFYIKASLQPDFCCLSFPENFSRSKRNNIDLFTELLQKKIVDTRQYLNERCFLLQFEDGRSLLFKMHGNRSNIIACQEDTPYKLFKSNFPDDLNLNLSDLDRPIEQTKEAYELVAPHYKKLFPTFGKLINQYLQSIQFEQKTMDEQWEILDMLVQDLENPKRFFLTNFNDNLHFSLLPIGEIQSEYTACIEGITAFFHTYVKESFILKEKKQLTKALEKRIVQVENYIRKSERKLFDIENKPGYDQLADIIMANLHQIPARAEEVTLFNFYTNQNIAIRLKPRLSPQKNAENYYRKAKNQKREVNQLSEAIEAKKDELNRLKAELKEVIETEDVKTLKKLVKNKRPTSGTTDEKLPYRKFEIDGYSILVGKGAKDNDQLTLKHTWKEDIWLHAKDVTGSHVVLKTKSNIPTPEYIIEKAAQLAAFYSKRKTDSLCPVIFTPKKFVRKPKGLPPGKVHVDKEEVMLVTPEIWWKRD